MAVHKSPVWNILRVLIFMRGSRERRAPASAIMIITLIKCSRMWQRAAASSTLCVTITIRHSALCMHHGPKQNTRQLKKKAHTPKCASSRYSANNNFAPRVARFYFCIFASPSPLYVYCAYCDGAAGTFLCTLVMRVQLKYVYIINGALPYLFYDTDRADFTPKYVNQMWKHASECVGLRERQWECVCVPLRRVCVLCASERAREYLFCAYALHLAATALRQQRARCSVCLMRIKYVLIH